jgi:prophage maintenance system killer protein
VAAGIILCESGFDFLVSEEEEERFVLSVASCNEHFESITQWLKKMAKKKEFTC